MWVVCKLKADRSLGVLPLGHVYPDKAIPIVEFGEHESRNDALKALVVAYYPELLDSSIEHLKRVSKCFLGGSMKTHKIVNYK